MKMLFLMPVATDARCWRRVQHLVSFGADAHALAFQRAFYPGRSELPCPLEILGHVDHGRYIRRSVTYARALRRVREFAKHVDVVYAFGSDLALLARMSLKATRRPPPIVLEVADIREVLVARGITGNLVRFLERRTIKHVAHLVVTSTAYQHDFYERFLRSTPTSWSLLENKVSPNSVPALNTMPERPPGDYLTIGYFGVLRCQRSWDILAEALRRAGGRLRLLLRGYAHGIRLDGLEELTSKGLANFAGPFVAPDDLPEMYRSVDVVWACYPFSHSSPGNWQWARTNRYYESLAFRVPLIVSAGTQDAAAVERLGVGCQLPLADVATSVQGLLALDRHSLNFWRTQLESVLPHEYQITTEYDLLYERLAALERSAG